MEIKPVLHAPNIPTDAPAAPTTDWNGLPKDIKKLIVSHCCPKGLAKLKQTSKSDNKLVHDWAIREAVPTSKVRKFPDLETYLATLQRYSNLKYLNLSNVLINDKTINNDQFNTIINYCLKKDFKIEVLDLRGLQISLENCPSLTHLTELNLGWNEAVTDATLNQFLEGCQAIEKIYYPNTYISTDLVEEILRRRHIKQ